MPPHDPEPDTSIFEQPSPPKTRARADPEEQVLPGNTGLTYDYSPTRSPSFSHTRNRSISGTSNSPVRSPTRASLKPSGSSESISRVEPETPSGGNSRQSSRGRYEPSSRTPFMPTPRSAASRSTPSASAPTSAPVSKNYEGLMTVDEGESDSSMAQYPERSAGTGPLRNSTLANAPMGDTSMNMTGKPTIGGGAYQSKSVASHRTSRFGASQGTAISEIASPTPASGRRMTRASVRLGLGMPPQSGSGSGDQNFNTGASGRASPKRFTTTSTPGAGKLRAKVTEGVRVSPRKRPAEPPVPNVFRSTVTPGVGAPGLGISMGIRPVPGTEGLEEEESEMADCSFDYVDGVEEAEQEQESVLVHVRLRPPKSGEKCAWVPSPSTSSISLDPALASQRVQPGAGAAHTFDGLLTGSSNRPVYVRCARPLVRAALGGYDAVVFAYGQTASGKTFTLSGDEAGKEPGIIPRAVRDIFRGIRQSSGREYLLRASYLEIWNESVKDLLDPGNLPQIRDDRRSKKGTFVHPLREEIVTSPAQVRDLLARGQANRHVGATDWNERSSRSHTCFQMTVESWERTADGDMTEPTDLAARTPGGSRAARPGRTVRISQLSLIDLAGSEKYVSQGGDRRTEGAHINKSLLTLGKVIFALSEEKKGGKGATHVPYRDSKLTRILQNSLSGNARVAVICTLNPSPGAVDESLSTLSFAKRVKKVSLHARRNEVEGELDGLGAEAQALLVRYRNEMEGLRRQVAELQDSRKDVGGSQARLDDERVVELQERLDMLSKLMIRSGNVDESEDENEARPPRPVSPTKARGFDFDDPPHVLQEKLYLASKRIASLEADLASRPVLPASCSSDESKDKLIAQLQQQVHELEMVCEAQAADAPPKIREDVEREWAGKVRQVQARLAERETFVKQLGAECERLRRTNKQLIQLAHGQTAEMVASLRSGQLRPIPGGGPRPVSVLGPLRSEMGGADVRVPRTDPTISTSRFRPRRSISQDAGLGALARLPGSADPRRPSGVRERLSFLEADMADVGKELPEM